jgi:hypothetical protein
MNDMIRFGFKKEVGGRFLQQAYQSIKAGDFQSFLNSLAEGQP